MWCATLSAWRYAAAAVSVLLVCGEVARSETLGQKQQAAAEAVREALQREVYGLDEDRCKLLDEAAEKVTDFAPAMWHRGFIRDANNRWIEHTSLIQQPQLSAKLTSYEKVQSAVADTVAGHLAAAAWCSKEGLPDQRRAHLARVLDLDTDHAATRAELGFRRINGEWKSEKQLDAEQQAARAEQVSLNKYRTVLEEIRKGFADDSQARREAARKRLLAIREVDAIPAMESILSTHGDEAALAVIENVAAITDPVASISLARHAVYHPSLIVREAAVEKLKNRDTFSFVPQLLSMMYTPVTTQIVTAVLPGGRLGYRHAFVREGQEKKELLVLDTNYVRIARVGGDRRESAARAASQVQTTAVMREAAALAQNRFTQQLNDRIAWVLKMVTGEQLPAVPADWWAWWNNQNEVEQQGEKTLAYVQQQTSVAVVDRVVTGGGSTGGQTSHECLVAGTPIWTISGPRAVEKIRVGDMVLAQDAESGELAYKPVLRSTVRPTGKIVKFVAGGETFQTSGGHVFWVSGQGWRKSSQLQSGMVLHSIQGPVRVSTVEPGEDAETYNLIVADFNTYFVGDSKILSHDFTQRQATRTIVPGLKQE